jgi:hypothetical protein
MEMSVKERLREFVDYKNIGRNRFEELVEISIGYLSTKSPSVGSGIIEKIARIYNDLNLEWLITGKGDMIKGTVKFDPKLVFAPLVSRYAQTEYITRLHEATYINTLPTLPIIVENDEKGGYICFEMWDNSMNNGADNSYNQGDILICKEIDHSVRKKLYLTKPRPFVIVFDRKIIATQIISHNLEKQTIEVRSLNPEDENRVLELQNVKRLFYVFKLQRIIT